LVGCMPHFGMPYHFLVSRNVPHLATMSDRPPERALHPQPSASGGHSEEDRWRCHNSQ
jgi:hypothetical protein